MALVGISLGSNLGDRLANLRSAIRLLRALRSSPHLLSSSVYETSPVDCPPWSEDFYNAAVEIESHLSPHDLLREMQAIECAMGRSVQRSLNEPRVIDLDLLYYDNLHLGTDELVLPHPRMRKRLFVMEPLSEIRPDLATELELVRLREESEATRRLGLSLVEQ